MHDLSNNPELKDGDYDYAEPHNVSAIHSQLAEGKSPNGEGSEPVAIWYIVIVGVVLFGAGFYFAMFSGGFRHDAYTISGGPSGGKAGAEGPKLSLAQIGEKVYGKNCVTCHMANGMGTPGVYPPLVGSEFVLESSSRLTAILLHGIKGPITVKGQTVNGQMEPLGRDMKDEQLAAVMTYIRSAWGNTGSEIKPDQVAAARIQFKDQADYYTEAELLAITGDLPPSADAAAPAPAAGAPAPAPAP